MVAIRLQTPAAHQSTAAECLSERTPDAPVAAGDSILVVENHEPTSESIVAALSPAHRVMRAASAAEARALLRAHRFDVVFVSLGLPGNVGIRFLTELKRTCDIPVVAMVGGGDFFSLNYQLRMATTVGANGALLKPVRPDRTRVLFDQALSRRQAGTRDDRDVGAKRR